MKKEFITFENISVRLGSALVVRELNWEIEEGEQWAVLGPNGSGKSSLVRALFGGVAVARGRIIFHFEKDEARRGHPALVKDKIGYVSFELHQKLMKQEEFQQFVREFKGTLDEEYTSARDVILSGVMDITESGAKVLNNENHMRAHEMATRLGIAHLMDHTITALSTGEMRKALIARALMKEPRLLILDEPFDGLDESSRESLKETIDRIIITSSDNSEHGCQVILITHRVEEIPSGITHALLIKEGTVIHRGEKGDVLTGTHLSELYGCMVDTSKDKQGNFALSYRIAHQAKSFDAHDLGFYEASSTVPDVLIDIRDATVSYGGIDTLSGLTWCMNKGENWCVLGPNGSGKSTIIKLILGENVQGYANDIRIFGVKKGSGESVWDLKENIGIVSGELQVQYWKNMSALDVIASGFYNSIGLYQYPTSAQKQAVLKWADALELGGLIERNFHHLSYGQRRLVLIARAMVKSPVLLILDEPCHGLDIPNRKRVLELIELIGDATPTNILYVTHHPEEVLPCMTHVLRLERGAVLAQGKKEDIL